jgi:hypothetical protein
LADKFAVYREFDELTWLVRIEVDLDRIVVGDQQVAIR